MKRGIKPIVILLICLLIIFLSFCISDDKKHRVYNPDVPYLIPTYYNNSTHTYELHIGPIYDEHEKPLEDIYVTITINNTLYDGNTNSSGIALITIPALLINEEEWYVEYEVEVFYEGYEDTKFKIRLDIIESANP